MNMPRKKLKTAIVAGITFQGESVVAAKVSGEREIAELVREANIGPSLYHVHDMTVLVWRTLETWNYRILETYKGNGAVSASCCFTAENRDDACTQAVFACAQYQWNPEWSESSDDEFTLECFRCLRNSIGGYRESLPAERKRIDLDDWIKWQRLYQAVYAVCGDRNMSHDIASRYRDKESAVRQASKEIGLAETV
jgi:hypothetical protein